MKSRWLFLAMLVLAGVFYVGGQFWHPSLTDTISFLIVILTWILLHLVGQVRQIIDRLGRIEAELKKQSNAPGDAILEKVTELDNRCEALERTLEDHQSAISWQLECTRRLQQISESASELRTSATARFLGKDESANEVAVLLLGSIRQEVESFVLPFFEGRHLSVLSMHLEKIQRAVREAALASPALSLEQIESETRSILQELDAIDKWAKTIEDEEMPKRVAEIKRAWSET